MKFFLRISCETPHTPSGFLGIGQQTALFKSSYKFWLGLRCTGRLWLGHSRTFTLAFTVRLDGWFVLEDKSSPELFFPKLSQIVFGDIFLHSCSFCLSKPSRTCCWEASHSRTLLPPCVTVETLCSWRRAVFSNRQTYYWGVFFAFENKELSSSWLLSFPRASGRIQGESSPEHFFF